MSDISESSSNSSLAPREEPLPSRFSQVARVREYLKWNIKELQNAIDLHEPSVGQDPQSREQGTSMTPKVHRDTGVNTDLNPRP